MSNTSRDTKGDESSNQSETPNQMSPPEISLQVALAHLLFNIIGIMIWFPYPRLRAIPLKGARILGEYSIKYKLFPFIYIGTVFFAIPGIAYGITYGVGN